MAIGVDELEVHTSTTCHDGADSWHILVGHAIKKRHGSCMDAFEDYDILCGFPMSKEYVAFARSSGHLPQWVLLQGAWRYCMKPGQSIGPQVW